ncbi:MAG TPA: jacalin-like lectin [Longimicrobiaceae bacterium]|nr:jacalin-like lectin [Longimicrobiaceae bacterium]
MIARHAVALAGLLVLAAGPAPGAAQELDAGRAVPVAGGWSLAEGTTSREAGDGAAAELILLPTGAAQQGFVDACALSGFRINAGWWIDGMQVACADGAQLAWRGGTGGGQNVFSLMPGERIVAISGLAGGNSGPHLYALQIHTDRRSSPVYGNGGAPQGDPGRVPFRLNVPQGYTLVGITGRTSQFLLSIGLVLASPVAGG